MPVEKPSVISFIAVRRKRYFAIRAKEDSRPSLRPIKLETLLPSPVTEFLKLNAPSFTPIRDFANSFALVPARPKASSLCVVPSTVILELLFTGLRMLT